MTDTRPIQLGIALDNFGYGGTELNAVRTIELLDRKRYAVHLLSLSNSGPLLSRFKEAGVTIHHLPISNIWGAAACRTGLRVRDIVRELRLDILHAHDHYSGVFTVPWVRTTSPRIPIIVSRRWWKAPSAVHALLARFAVRGADKVLVNCQALASHVALTERVPTDHIAVVPNFVEEWQVGVPTPEEQAKERRLLGIPKDQLTIGVIARLNLVKDHATVLNAFAPIAYEYSNVHLAVVGDGPERQRLQQMAEGLGIASRVTFAGHHSGKRNFNHAMDISVLASKHEGFPNTVVEAMAAGRPVVVSAVGGVPDAVQDQENGLLFPPGDALALQRQLRALLVDAALRERLGCAALETVRARFVSSRVLHQLEALYSSLILGQS